MKKIYLLFIFVALLCFSFTSGIQAQDGHPKKRTSKNLDKIPGLRIFPNPATGDIVYITSDKQLTKTVEIHTILGKQALYKVLIGKELDISKLNNGVYVIKITEGQRKATRKLIIE